MQKVDVADRSALGFKIDCFTLYKKKNKFSVIYLFFNEMNKFFIFLFAVLLSTSILCAGKPNCKIVNDRLYSKEGSYSIQLPKFLSKPRCAEEYLDDQVTTVVCDDFGLLFRVERCWFPKDFIEKYHLENSKEVTFKILEQGVLQNVKNLLPGAEIISQEFVDLDSKQLGYISMISFPNGSLLMNAKTKERFDSMRGHLMFFDGSDLIMVCLQNDNIFQHRGRPLNKEVIAANYRQELLDLANSYRAENYKNEKARLTKRKSKTRLKI